MNEQRWLYGKPDSYGTIKQIPEDFYVSEQLGFLPDGAGEHLFVRIKKQGYNTTFIAEQLAKFAKLPMRSVSYAGLKDRHAVTEQWFCLHLAGKPDPDWQQFKLENCQILTSCRHQRKLKIGCLAGNEFRIVIRDITHPETLSARLQAIAQHGVPNYFGEQRFGHDDNNWHQAERWAKGDIRVTDRKRRSFYLSAIRSKIFNRIVDARLERDHIMTPMEGDIMQLVGSKSWFVAKQEELGVLTDRIQQHDIVITAPLIGEEELASQGEALAFEQQQLAPYTLFSALLQQQRVTMARRAVMVIPKDFHWQWAEHDKTLMVEFSLPSGSFATSVIREIIEQKERLA